MMEMKGLLRKEFYMFEKRCKSYIAMVLLFCVIGLVGDDNLFFYMYACVISGMLPVTMLSYDEKEKWESYAELLPCTRGQFVAAKYIFGVIQIASTVLLSMVCLTIKALIGTETDIEILPAAFVTLCAVAFLVPSVLLPFIFKLGVERGRIAFYIVIGISCCVISSVVVMDVNLPFAGTGSWIEIAALLVITAAYAFSCRLSMMFYEKREL